MSKIVMGVLAVVAVAGWALAAVVWNQSRSVEDELQASGAEKAKLAEELDAAQGKLDEYLESVGRLKVVDQKVGESEERIAAVDQKLSAALGELDQVTKETEARRAELEAIEADLLGREAEIAAFEGEIVRAGRELVTLQAEAEELRRKVEPLQAEMANLQSEGSGAAAPAKAVEAATKVVDKGAEMSRRFEIVDQNGDGKIDEFEFRFNSIKLMDLVDANQDGSITKDETLMSEESFKLIEADGDGKISALEFADVNTFRHFDSKKQGYLTLEDILALTKEPAQ